MTDHSEYIEGGPRWGLIGDAAFLVAQKCAYAVDLGTHCESPIEVQLAAELMMFPPFSDGAAHIIPQFKLDRFRFDFAVRLSSEAQPRVFIECDGLAFHSTPEQLANDRLKDDAVTRRGWKILRFTGRDIYRRPKTCCAEIRKALGEAHA